MEHKQDIEKEQLIANLKGRLKWYQEEATDDEIDVKEISTILELLEQLEPNTGKEEKTPEEAYALFKEKYLPAYEKRKGIHTDTSKKVHFFQKKAVRYTAMAAAVIVLLFTVLNIGTYAAARKGFFEFLWQNNSGKSFFVTGETGESMDMQEGMGFDVHGVTEYASWDELPEEVLEQIYVPTYIPEGLEMITLECWGKRVDTLKAFYKAEIGQKDLQIWIEHYEEPNTWQQGIQEEAEFLFEEKIDEKNCFFYRYQDEIIAYFFTGTELYTVFGNSISEEIETIVKKMQYID